MYDKFQPFQTVEMQSFLFESSRYEIWQGGQKVGSGNKEMKITAIPNESSQMNIQIQDNNGYGYSSENSLTNEIANVNCFDKFITSTDRLQLITIPNTPEINNMGVMAIKMIIGATRNEKHFENNEPYCCNLFVQNSNIAKVTFSFCNPERMIEFYQ